MAIYEQCAKCCKFILEGEDNYFSGVGLVCKECSRILLRKKEKENEMNERRKKK